MQLQGRVLQSIRDSESRQRGSDGSNQNLLWIYSGDNESCDRDVVADLHGRTREWNGITCLAMYHPAAILRTPTVEMRRIYEDDFRKIPVLLAEARRKHAALAAAALGILLMDLR